MSTSYTLVPNFMTTGDDVVDVLCDCNTSASNLVKHEFEDTYRYFLERLQDLKERSRPLPMGDDEQLVDVLRVMLQMHRALYKEHTSEE